MFGQFRCADAQAPNASLFQQKRARRGARFDRHDLVVRRKGRSDRRGRSLSPYRSGGAQLSRPHRTQRSHVRTARLHVRLPLLRHSLVRELCVRAGRLGQRRADPGDRADHGDCGHAPPARPGRRAASLLGPGPCLRGARDYRRAQRAAARRTALRAICARQRGGSRGGRAHRHHQSRREAVALWAEGLALSQQAVSNDHRQDRDQKDRDKEIKKKTKKAT